MTHVEVKNEFLEKHTWELWMIFIMKMVTSLVFLMDDLTFLVFCEKEFNMTDQEAGILFCVTAICLFGYGLTISGYLIDRLGVKYSLAIGFTSITLAKFLLTFADSLTQLYLIMCTISPFGISIIFPCLVLGVKKLSDNGSFRSISFSFYYAFMVLGALLGGPIVDFIRRDIGRM
jgi:predicted MFS family arabinose efflux permease